MRGDGSTPYLIYASLWAEYPRSVIYLAGLILLKNDFENKYNESR